MKSSYKSKSGEGEHQYREVYQRYVDDGLKHFDSNEFIVAYEYFSKALGLSELIPQQSYYCELSLLECQLSEASIDITEARTKFEALKEDINAVADAMATEIEEESSWIDEFEESVGEQIKRLEQLLKKLSNEQAEADYLYNYAHLVNRLVSNSVPQEKTALQMLGLISDSQPYETVKDVPLLSLIPLLEQAIVFIQKAKEAYQHNSSWVASTQQIESSLYEKLADFYYDYAQKIQGEQMIAYLQKANACYTRSLFLLQSSAQETDTLFSQSQLYFSILQTLQELAELDGKNYSEYTLQMRNWVEENKLDELVVKIEDSGESQSALQGYKSFYNKKDLKPGPVSRYRFIANMTQKPQEDNITEPTAMNL